MEFRQLQTFIEVVHLGSFSKAAEKLYLTQPTVTSHIQALEKELDTILLNRYSKDITTTGAGELLYNYAVDLIKMRDMATFDLSAYHGIVKGHLNIACSSIPRLYLLPSIMKKFTSICSDISFSVTERDSRNVIDDILEGYTDFGLIGAKFPERHIEYIEFFEDTLCLITPNNEDFPFPNGTRLDKDFVLNHRLLLREQGSGTRQLIEDSFLTKVMEKDSIDNISYIEDGETIKKFVEKNIGISFISESAVHKEVAEGSLKKFYIKGFDFKRCFYFAFHNKRKLSPLSNKFKDFILNEKF